MNCRATVLAVVLLCGCVHATVDPNSDQLVAQADSALQAGEFHSALVLADSVVELRPSSADGHFLRGRIYFELKQWARAEAAYQSVLNLDSEYLGIHHNLGNVYFAQRQNRLALYHFAKAAQISDAAMSWHAVGGAYNELGQPDSALAAYQRAIQADSLYAPAHAGLADWFEERGQFEDAIASARRALDLRPDYLPFRLLVVRLLVRMGHAHDALPDLRSLIQEYSYAVEPKYLLGHAFQQLGDSSQSRSALAEAESLRVIDQSIGRLANAAERNPSSFAAWMEYAQTLRSSRRHSEALYAYQIARSLRPRNLGLLYHLSTLHQELGNAEASEAGLLRILAADSTHVLAWLSLGYTYSRTGRPDLAQDAWRTATRIDPNHPAIRTLQARAPALR